MKKVVVLIAILLALGAVSYFYFNENQKQSASKQLYMSIPKQFPLALESDDWEEVFEKVDTFSYFQTMKAQDWMIGAQLNLEELFQFKFFLHDNQLYNLYSNTLLAFGNAGNSQLGILIAAKAHEKLKLNNIVTALSQSEVAYTVNSFEQQDIITIDNDPEGNLAPISFTLSNQIFLCSHQASFVEDALISLTAETNSLDTLYAELDGPQDVKCYLKPEQLNYLSSYFLQAEAAPLMDVFQTIASQSIFQLDFFPESFSVSGFVNQGEGTLTDTLKGFNSASLQCVDYLPANTALYKGIGIANNGDYFNDDYDLKRINSIIDEAFVLFTLESYSEKLSDRQGAIFPLKDVGYLQVLMELDTTITLHNSLGDLQIYKGNLGALLNKTFYTSTYFEDEVYFLSINDMLVLSSNYAVCEQFVFAQQDEKTLRTDAAYTAFKSASATKSNLDYYINLAYLQPYLNGITTNNTWQNLFEKGIFQFANIGELSYCNGKFGFKSNSEGGSKQLWAASLEDVSTFPAQVVVNHNNDKNEIVIQDEANNLYLLNASGEKLWHIPLEGKILSKIKQIDYYKNRKLQLVFNTEDKIYIVDRNGNLVDGFPISLPSKASNGMLLVNYDNAGKYRYMVACDNGNVYGYEQTGSPLPGWNPKKDVGQVSSPIQHVLHEGKDYIYFNNTEGKFFALNRKGEDRFAPVQTNNQLNNFYFEGGQFIGGDYGTIFMIDTKGEMLTKVLLDSTYRNCMPANSLLEGVQAFAFSAESNFKFQQSQWKNFGSFSTDAAIEKVESFTYQNRLWFVLKTASQTYLIDEIGNLHPDFPIASTAVTFVDLIPGKEKIMLYPDAQGNLTATEIGWTNL